MSDIHISFDVASNTAQAVLENAGLTPEDATIIREALLDAEASGRKGHGLARLPGIAARAAGCGSDQVRIERETAAAITIHGGDALGYLAAHRAARVAIERLHDQPLVAVACHHTTHTGAIGYYARLVAQAGHCALAMANCSPIIVPFGATSPVFGTNPVAFACPGPDHVLLADLSPARVTYGTMMNACHAGQSLPEGLALDRHGNPTTDPSAALEGGALPVGGPKGSALAFLIQIMSGALCGAAGVPEPGADYGFFLLGLRMDLFAEPATVTQGIAELAQSVHDTGGRCPGDRSEASRQEARCEGIHTTSALWDEIQALV